jgi:multidrug resistance efflux pump
MKKFNLIYIVAAFAGIILVLSFSLKINNTVTFYGFAENKETQINMENPIEVSRIHVTTGQKVKKGDILLDVFSSILPVKINEATYSIEELKTRYSMWKSDLDGRITESSILLNEKTSEIEFQIAQYHAQLDKNKKLASNLKSIDLSNTEKSDIKSPILLKIEALKEELKYSRNIITTQINNLKRERFAETNPMLSRIKILEKELDYYTTKKEKETIVAPTDGLIGNIHCKEDEKISSFTPLVTFYEESPTLVIGYIHEDLLLKVNLQDVVTVFSTSRPEIHNTGIIKTLGSRIVEIPPRIRKIKELKTFGREVIIEIPPDNPFLQKEKVTLTLNQ